MENQMLELYVKMQTQMQALGRRVREESGQTAAEYMGILFIVAIIIGAIVAAGIHKDIANAADGLIKDISGGGKEK